MKLVSHAPQVLLIWQDKCWLRQVSARQIMMLEGLIIKSYNDDMKQYLDQQYAIMSRVHDEMIYCTYLQLKQGMDKVGTSMPPVLILCFTTHDLNTF